MRPAAKRNHDIKADAARLTCQTGSMAPLHSACHPRPPVLAPFPSLPVVPTTALELLGRKRRHTNTRVLGAEASVITPVPQLFMFLPLSPRSEATIRHPARTVGCIANTNMNTKVGKVAAGVFEIGLGLTEISGEAGTGKTQLGLGICVSAAMASYAYQYESTVSPFIIHDKSSSSPASQRKRRRTPEGWIETDSGKESTGWSREPGELCVYKETDIAQSLETENGSRRIRNPYASPKAAPSLDSAAENLKAVHSPVNFTSQSNRQQLFHHHDLPKKTATFSHEQNPHKHEVQCYYNALYISMGEGMTKSQVGYRLSQIVEASLRMKLRGGVGSSMGAHDILSRIHVRFLRNDEEFLELIGDLLPSWMSDGISHPLNGDRTNKIGVIVFDSIAGIFRVPDTHLKDRTTFFAKRSGTLFQAAARLKHLSDSFNVPIVVVNQATSSISNHRTEILPISNQSMPALGMGWSNCVNERYLLMRTEEAGTGKFIRKARLLLSSRMSSVNVKFKIEDAGCRALEL